MSKNTITQIDTYYGDRITEDSECRAINMLRAELQRRAYECRISNPLSLTDSPDQRRRRLSQSMSTTVCLKWMSFLRHGLFRSHRAFEVTCAATLGTRCDSSL